MARKLRTLPPRVRTINTQRVRTVTGSWRDGKSSSTARGYDYKWQKERAAFLRANPLCSYCHEAQPARVTAATEVDHSTPHRGDPTIFWDRSRWVPACKPCHSAKTQRELAEERDQGGRHNSGWLQV